MPAYSPSIVGTVVETEPTQIQGVTKMGRMTTIAWTADGSGNVTYKTFHRFRGIISRVVTDPTSVSETYDLKLNDSHGIDLLGGAVTAASTSANAQYSAVGTVNECQVVDEMLWVVITSAGAGSTGYIYIYEL